MKQINNPNKYFQKKKPNFSLQNVLNISFSSSRKKTVSNLEIKFLDRDTRNFKVIQTNRKTFSLLCIRKAILNVLQ